MVKAVAAFFYYAKTHSTLCFVLAFGWLDPTCIYF